MHESLGKIKYGSSNDERKYKKFKRSIYISKLLTKENFTEENIKIIRPGHGLQPKFYNKILGKKAKANLKPGTALNASHF